MILARLRGNLWAAFQYSMRFCNHPATPSHLSTSDATAPFSRRPGQIRLALAIAFLLAILTISFVWPRLNHFIEVIGINNCVFGGDAVQYLTGARAGEFAAIDPRRHFLALVAVSGLSGIGHILGFSRDQSFLFAFAALDVVFVITIFALFLRLGGNLALALAMTLWTASTNAILTQLSMPETYILTMTLMAGAALFAIASAPKIAGHPVRSGVLMGVAAGLCALANLPAATVSFIYAWLAWNELKDRKPAQRFLLALALPCAVAGFIGLLPGLGGANADGPTYFSSFSNSWATFANFFKPHVLADYASISAFFAWASPYSEAMCRYIVQDLPELIKRTPANLAMAATAGLLSYAILRLRRNPMRSILPGILAAIGTLLVFYIYFNPIEAILYSCQWVLLMLMASANRP